MNKVKDLIDNYLNDRFTNSKQIELFYKIGKIIKENNIDLKKLELYLKEYYGVVISFTERNLKSMLEFTKYQNIDKLKNITWKNILVILKHNDDLIDICLKYKPTKYELLDYIRNKTKLKEKKEIELDDMLEELLKLKEDLK